MGLHAVIEFANRLLTSVVVVVVAVLIVIARFQRDPRPQVTRRAWAQFGVVVLNAVVGGVTVLAELNPYIVASHFLAAVLLLAAAAVTWDILDRGRSSQIHAGLRGWVRVLLIASVLLLISETVVTGSGPHAGDSADGSRMGFDWATMTLVHTCISGAVVVAAAKIRWSSPLGSRLRSHATGLLMLLAAQTAVGVLQSQTGLPNAAVVAHMLGAALIVIGATRVTLETTLTTQRPPVRSGRARQEKR
jgi:cytochrome c oxidase assembly protein subunit 15